MVIGFFGRCQNSIYGRYLYCKWLATPLISMKMNSAYMFVFTQIKSVLYERFAQGLDLKQRYKVTRKCPKGSFCSHTYNHGQKC